MTSSADRLARVVVLAGPSGAGKSRLAARLRATRHWPVVRLDDFYRDGDDPALPTVDLGGRRLVDWDDVGSWDLDAAVEALRALVTTGSADLPTYDLASSTVVGTSRETLRPDGLVLAEGIFAAETIPALASAGLLHSAWCVRRRPGVTFVLRLVRDLAERRKPPRVLLRRGLALWRAEPLVVARMESLGAQAATPRQVEATLRSR